MIDMTHSAAVVLNLCAIIKELYDQTYVFMRIYVCLCPHPRARAVLVLNRPKPAYSCHMVQVLPN